MSENNEKVMTAAEAVRSFIQDGDMMAVGGFVTNRRPYGLIREIIKQNKKLYIESGSAGGDIDMLIGNGQVIAVNISYIANSGFTMVGRRFRDAVENGKLPFEDYSLDVQTIAYHGAALGLPFVPVKNMLGSDLVDKWAISEEERKKYPKLPPKKFVIIDDPFNPGSELCCIPTPKIDVAVVHCQLASPDGTCRISGSPFQDIDIAMAAKHTIVSCEKLVSNEEIRKHPELNTLSGLCVDAVVPMEYGAHPSQCFGAYDYDRKFYKAYEQASKTQEDFEAFLKEYVLDHENHEAYLKFIGEQRLKSLCIDPELGYGLDPENN